MASLLQHQFVRFVLLLSIWRIPSSLAYKQCSQDEGGGVCPSGNTCCPTGTAGVSSCITQPAHEHNGTSVCCTDDTGCGPGYKCGVTKGVFPACLLMDQNDTAIIKPPTLERYKLCSLPQEAFTTIHTIRVGGSHYLPYYSTKLSSVQSKNEPTKRVIIVVHGSGRNADDYLCCMSQIYPPIWRQGTLLLAPRFLAPKDGPQPVKKTLLRWNETDPIPHTWRYGADAIGTNISSFDAMDSLVEQILERLPNIERIIAIGHSAGGQFVHRWALASNSPVWNNSETTPIRVVAANPRSYAYLDGRRYNPDGNYYAIPSQDRINKCPSYNSWEWGLNLEDSRLSAPYVKRAFESAGGGLNEIVQQYATRDVRYLIGELDNLPVHAECEDDDFQGPNRNQRAVRFFGSLKEVYGQQIHQLVQNMGTPHDHCLLFQSSGAILAMFGESEAVKQFGMDTKRNEAVKKFQKQNEAMK